MLSNKRLLPNGFWTHQDKPLSKMSFLYFLYCGRLLRYLHAHHVHDVCCRTFLNSHVTAASPRQGRVSRFQGHANQNGLGISGRIERRSKSFRAGVSGETVFVESIPAWPEQRLPSFAPLGLSVLSILTTRSVHARGSGSGRAIRRNLRTSRQVRI